MASSSYFPVGENKYGGDVENALFPGISSTENMLRLGFINKVSSGCMHLLFLSAIYRAYLFSFL